MKKLLVFVIMSLILLSLVLALDNSSNLNSSNDNEDNEDDENDEDDENENRTIANNTDTEDNEKESPKTNMRDIRKEVKNGWRNRTSEEKRQFINEVKEERNRINFSQRNITCPLNCSCSGSTVKCYLDDGTREMTVYAGRSGNVIVQIKGENMTTNVTLYHHDGKIFGVFKNKTGNDTREIVITPEEVKEKIREKLRTRACDNNNCSINLEDNGLYKVKVEKNARLFALFPIKERVRFSVDSETGNVTITKPWWRFLAREVND